MSARPSVSSIACPHPTCHPHLCFFSPPPFLLIYGRPPNQYRPVEIRPREHTPTSCASRNSLQDPISVITSPLWPLPCLNQLEGLKPCCELHLLDADNRVPCLLHAGTRRGAAAHGRLQLQANPCVAVICSKIWRMIHMC
jgi:hypothetical protein